MKPYRVIAQFALLFCIGACRGDHASSLAELAVEVRIGSHSKESPEYSFSQIGEVAEDSAGQLYVSDPINAAVARINIGERSIKRFGRRGFQAGEFMEITGLFHRNGMGLGVIDRFAGKITLLNDDSRVMAIRPWDQYSSPRRVFSMPDGSLVMLYLSLNPTEEFSSRGANLFHVYTSEFTYQESFGSLREVETARLSPTSLAADPELPIESSASQIRGIRSGGRVH